MDIEGSSGQHFPNWDAAYAHYKDHYHRGCIHVLLRTSPQKSASPPHSPTPDIVTSNPRKKKTKTVKSTTIGSAASKRHRRPRRSSSTSAGNYRSMYEDDDPVPPAVANPTPPSAVTFSETLSPGNAGNPIEVPSNFPTPAANKNTPKRRNQLQGPGLVGLSPITPTPASAAPSTIRPLVYVCDCSDETGGYPASQAPSRKRKATIVMNAKSDTSVKRKVTSAHFAANANMASSSTSQPIDILTDSEDETDIRPLPKYRFCKCLCLHLQTHASSSAAEPNLNPDTTDGIPEILCPSPTQA